MILVYTSCKNMAEAKKIGLALLKKRLVACVGFIPKTASMYFWPPRKNRIQKANEIILLAETVKEKFSQIEKEVKKVYSYSTPAILAIPVSRASKDFLGWLKDELI